MQYVPSGPRDLCCCAAGFITLYQKSGENPSHGRGDETCSGISVTSGVWILVSAIFLFPKMKLLVNFRSLHEPILVITKQHDAYSVRLCKTCGSSEYAEMSVYTFSDSVFYTCCMAVFFSYLSQTKKCMATVRVALVKCLVALLEVSSQRSYLAWSFKYRCLPYSKMLDLYLLYVTCRH